MAATHQNLERLVEQGLSEGLFHRLNVIRVHVPSLSERREDIPLLAKHFLDAAAIELGDEPKILDAATAEYLSLLLARKVRQLENTCRWLQVMASSRTILIEDLPPELQQSETNTKQGSWETGLELWANQQLEKSPDMALLDTAMPKFERIMINAALRKSGGRKKDAAELLGWGRNTLTRKMQELQL